jgi:hypothetical protein
VLVWSEAWKAEGEEGSSSYTFKHTLETAPMPRSPQRASFSNPAKLQEFENDNKGKTQPAGWVMPQLLLPGHRGNTSQIAGRSTAIKRIPSSFHSSLSA